MGTYSEATAGRPAACTFVASQGRSERTLKIEVETVANAHLQLESMFKGCSSAAIPLKAIGNEAERCDRNGGKRVTSEFLAGRVRDQIFSISISATLRKDPELDEGMLQAKIVTAAEQVSGSLF